MAVGMTSTRRPLSVCCDANIVVRFITEPHATAVQELWSEWHRIQASVVAPLLLRFEVTNAVHRIAKRDKLSLNQASAILDSALNIPIRFIDRVDIHVRALALSRELNLPAAYDAHYLALAELEGIELFTSDHRLYNNARHRYPWIRLVE
jgi:predicted nucleic acid-binding protein